MTNHYIRQGATGNNTGTDWTNAYGNLPSTLIRGDTYYIADGSYGGFMVDDAVSGTLYITIKKATIADHGTDTGWNSSYGDGQAVFTPLINIITSYVVFDGVVGAGATTGVNGSGSDPSTYGFKITPSNCTVKTDVLLGVPGIGYYNTVDITHVTISHVALIQCGAAYDSVSKDQYCIYSFPKTGSYITISYAYFDNGSTNILSRIVDNMTISHNYFARNWYSVNNPSVQQISPGGSQNDMTINNNIFKNTSTFQLWMHGSGNGQQCKRLKFYNNIIIGGNCGIGSESQYSDLAINWEVHQNSFIDTACNGTYGAVFVGNLTDVNTMKSYVYNNLFYNSSNPKMNNSGYTPGAIIHTHNAHFNSSGVYDKNEGGTAMDVMGDPFINSINKDYHLKQPTQSGQSLPIPFNIDMDGNIRGADGVWDRGAYEYVSTQECPTPIVSFNLNII